MVRVPKVTRSDTWPMGVVVPVVTPVKGLVGMRRSYGTCIWSNIVMERTLRPAPPSISVLETATLLMVGVQTSGTRPTILVVEG